MRIVIAADPEPFTPLLQLEQEGAVVGGDTLGRLRAVKAVAERHDARGRDGGNHLGQPLERRARVVRRQQHAERGKGGALLQMQVGHQQRVLLLPIERAGGERPHRVSRDVDMRTQ